MKQTKIIATIGPASDNVTTIRKLIQAGADCFRLNFSHGDGASMLPYIQKIREAAKAEKKEIPILADVQGPKLRIGKLPREGITLHSNDTFIITGRELAMGNQNEVHSPYEFLTTDVKIGTRLLLADGVIELEVKAIENLDVHCQVKHGGRLYSNKGINIPKTKLSVDTLTEKDKTDLEFIAQADIDLVAISFVRTAQDIKIARNILRNDKSRKVSVMAKLEVSEALDNLSEIIEEADGVMVARGDLGVELPFEEIPWLQKEILKKSTARGKWAMVATQMLGSMVLNQRPSRAEVSDVANAVMDGADAMMLSEETAAGNHPIEAVRSMAKIASSLEEHQTLSKIYFESDITSFAAAAAGAVISATERLHAKAIVLLTGSDLTALLISKRRPHVPILALSAQVKTLRRLHVLWGVYPVLLPQKTEMEEQILSADDFLITHGIAKVGEPVIVAASIPLNEKKETNTIRFHRVRMIESEGWATLTERDSS